MPTDLDIEKYKNKILREWVDNLTKEVLYLEEHVDSKDTIIKNLKKDNDGMCVTIDRLRGEGLSTYLEKEDLAERVAELKKEIERLCELNNNQARLIANNRTKRSDFHV